MLIARDRLVVLSGLMGEREQEAVTWHCPGPAGPPEGDVLLPCLPVPHGPRPFRHSF